MPRFIIETIGGGDQSWLASDHGITHTAPLPMELLVLSRPDRLITGARWPGHSQAEAILDHPALAAMTAGPTQATDRDWICGIPSIPALQLLIIA